jgi:hypothetical protein
MSMTALVGALSLGCGEDAAPGPATTEPADSDAGADAATDVPEAVLDADLPQSAIATVGDAGDPSGDAGSDAGVYELDPNTVTTCGQFFECVQDCRVDYDSCMGPCNDAMTVEAASLVHDFMNCVARNGCRNGGCITQRCSQEAQACFSSPY